MRRLYTLAIRMRTSPLKRLVHAYIRMYIFVGLSVYYILARVYIHMYIIYNRYTTGVMRFWGSKLGWVEHTAVSHFSRGPTEHNNIVRHPFSPSSASPRPLAPDPVAYVFFFILYTRRRPLRFALDFSFVSLGVSHRPRFPVRKTIGSIVNLAQGRRISAGKSPVGVERARLDPTRETVRRFQDECRRATRKRRTRIASENWVVDPLDSRTPGIEYTLNSPLESPPISRSGAQKSIDFLVWDSKERSEE